MPKFGSLVFDIETDGLLSTLTKVHVLSLKEVETGRKFVFNGSGIENGLDMLSDSSLIIGHNIIDFDLRALKKVYDYECETKVRDTLVLCRLLYPNQSDKDFRRVDRGDFPAKLTGHHTLKAWGYRLGEYKGDYSEIKEAEAKSLGITDPIEILKFVWGTWNQEMQDYCVQDVEVNTLLWEKLYTEIKMSSYPEAPIITEHRVQDLISTQETNGIYFNVPAALKLNDEITPMADEITKECMAAFPSRYVPEGKVYLGDIRKAFNSVDWEKAGDEAEELTYGLLESGDDKDVVPNIVIPKKTLRFKDPKRASRVVGWPFTPVTFQEFNPGSRQQIAERLLEMGWVPDEFSELGSPSVNEDTLKRASETIPIAKPLSDLFTTNKLITQLSSGDNAWLKKVTAEGKIHHHVNPCGAVTFRATHSAPNLGQVPAVVEKERTLLDGLKEKYIVLGREGAWGSECRSLFGVPKGWVMVGSDLSGIELRCLAHYMSKYDNGEYGRKLLTEDIHVVNQLAAGLETRAQAKTFIYAFCVPKDISKALTRTGWKSRDQLSIGEEILAYDPVSKTKKWTPILSFADYSDAKVLTLENKQFKFECTEDHRWFVRQRKEKFGFRNSVEEVRRTFDLNTESNIIVNAPMDKSEDTNYSSLDLIHDKWDTDWTKRVLSMSQSERVAFLEGFMIADGYYRSGEPRKNGDGITSEGWMWNQNVNELSEAALTATYLVHDGYVNTIVRHPTKKDMIYVTLNKKSHITGQKLNRDETRTTDVWCPNTQFGSWVCRQNNVITITGNCYGAGDEKLGSIVAPLASIPEQKRLGKELKAKFLKTLPAFNAIIKDIKKQVKSQGYLIGLDGRRLHVRSAHSALNTLLQSAGAIISKVWMLQIDDDLYEAGLDNEWEDYANMLYIHDELQYAVREGLEDEVKAICIAAAGKAGITLDFRMPVEATAKSGKTWKDTH